MYVNRDHKLVYLAHPRTASTSTARALLEHCGFEKIWRKEPANHHSRLWSFSDEPRGPSPVTKENRNEWTVFSVVRNHWDAAVSWVYWRTIYPEKADVETVRLALESQWVSANEMWWLHSRQSDIIIKYEDLEQHLAVLLESHGLKAPEIPRLNVSSAREGKHYSQLLEEDARNYIHYRFRNEIDKFDYKWEERNWL